MVLALVASLIFFSCGNLHKASNSTSIAIHIPVEQLANASFARAVAWSDDTAIYGVEVTLYVNGEPEMQTAEGTLLQLSQKTFLFEQVPLGSQVRAVAEVAKDGVLAWSGESQDVTLSAGINDLRIKMQKVEGPNHPTHTHIWDAGTITTPATENEDGIKTYTCTVCGETKIESIPKIEIVSLKIGSEFNSAITNKENIEKVVFGLLSDSDIKNIVSKATIAAAKVDVGAIPSTYYAYTVDTTLYIVPADEDAEKIVLNPDSNSLFRGFSECASIEGLSLLDTSNVTDMTSMFFECSVLTGLDLSGFDTSHVTNMSYMFYRCRGLTRLDLSNFNTSKVTNMGGMFSGCSKLTSLNVSNFDTSKVTNMGGMFSGCSKLKSLNVSKFDTSSVTNMWYMFRSCSSLESLDLSNFDTSKVTKMGSMFAFCSGLTSLDLSKFDTSNVADMSSMFDGCSGLTSLDLSKFDTSSVTSMSSMFSSCSGLTTLNVSNFDTQSVTNMSFMFSSCSGLTSLDLSNFDTSNVTNMSSMFKSCSGLTGLDLSSFDTSSVTSMESMFSGCSKLTTIYVADASNVPQNLQDVRPPSATFFTKS